MRCFPHQTVTDSSCTLHAGKIPVRQKKSLASFANCEGKENTEYGEPGTVPVGGRGEGMFAAAEGAPSLRGVPLRMFLEAGMSFGTV